VQFGQYPIGDDAGYNGKEGTPKINYAEDSNFILHSHILLHN
jgi:hypothetical protein